MKILVISQFYPPEPFRIGDICEELAKRGNDVTVITALPNYPKGEIYEGYEKKDKLDERLKRVHIIRCKSRPRHQGVFNLGLSYLSYMSKANKIVKKMQTDFDIVFVYQLSPVLMAIPAIKYKKKHNTPIYLYCLDVWPDSIRDIFKSEKSILYWIIKMISRRIYCACDMIGVTTRSFIKYLNEKCCVKLDNMVYLPQHAEDTYLCIPDKKFDEGIRNFSFMGNMSISQNLEVFIKAAAELEMDLKFHIHFIGNGPAENKLKSLVKDLHLEEKITFHGRHPLEEMEKFYSMADVCLLSLATTDNAIGFTIPGKLQGYMAAGKPVLAVIDGPAADLIKESNCGICVHPNDINSLVNAIREYILNYQQYKKCGYNGREYFKHHFTKKIFVDELEKQLLKTCSV